MRAFLATTLFTTLLAGAAQAQQAGSVYAFGDSLTDNGNIPKYLGGLNIPAPPYYKNHFSNGPVFVEYLPALIGARFLPGNDYGVGGAKAGTGNIAGIPQLDGTGTQTQIANAAASGLRFSAADTVILWAGSNNYFSIIGGLSANAVITDPALQADIRQVSGYVVSDAASLIALGARRVVVLNVPDLGSTPAQTMAGESLISTQLAQANNKLEQSGLLALHQQTGVNIYYVNAQLGIENILADPHRYGILNTTQECILTPACVNGSTAVQNTYLFWDDVHPTTGIHDYQAKVIANQLQAEQDVGGQGELMVLQSRDFTDSLAQRLDAQRAAEPGDNPISLYVQGHYASGSRGAGAASDGFDYDTGGVMAGADLRVHPGIIVGAAGGYGQPNAHFDSTGSGLGFNAYQGGVYASFFTRDMFLDVSGAYSQFDGKSTGRPGVLVGDVINFRPHGHGWSAGLGTGYVLHDGTLSWGPVAGISYVSATVDPYSENGENLLIQSVARQNIESLVGRAGLQATIDASAGKFSLRPHMSLQAEREFRDGGRLVDTSFTSAGLPLSTRLAGYTATYGVLDVGVATDLRQNLTALVDFQTVFGRGNGDDRSVLLKLEGHF